MYQLSVTIYNKCNCYENHYYHDINSNIACSYCVMSHDATDESLCVFGQCLSFRYPFMAKFSDTLHNASEKPFYQITHTIYLLETIYKIVPYRLGKPKTFLD